MTTRPIPSIPGALARSDGRVRFPTGRKWRRGYVSWSHTGAAHTYRKVKYRGVNYRVGRLVCEAFHGPQPAGAPVVLHLDEDAHNNRPENLRWGTMKENMNMPKYLAYCRSRTGERSSVAIGKRRLAQA